MADPKQFATDVAIIGSGGAGLAAGIEALDAGAKVIAFEMANEPGGASIISGAGTFMVGTPLQKENGIEDTPDLAFDDWIKWGGPSADEIWARYYIEHSLHDLYHWSEDLGVKWVTLNLQEGNTVRRWTQPERAGIGYVNCLIEGYNTRGGETQLNTEISKLKFEAGRVSGFEGTNSVTGEPVEVTAKTVILSTGGFNSNLEMILEIRPDLGNDRILEGSGPNSTGSGHRLVSGLGAYLAHMEDISFYVYATPDYLDPNQKRGLVCRGIPGYIWVNQQGLRFHDESKTGARSASPALMAQTPRHCWAILDQPMADDLAVADPQYRYAGEANREKINQLLANSPFIKKADTLEGLAKEMGMDVGAFLDTAERYNQACEQGLETEPEFGKPLAQSKPFDTPPYYGVQFFLLARKNLGGIKTDLRCRILNKHFEPIQGLYGAGEACGMAGGHINGRSGLEGTMFGPSIFSGRVAGGWAAEEAGHGQGFVGKPNRD